MWILTGPFDGTETTDANFHKSKLLKTGKTYNLGRRDQPLIIKHPRISKDHGEFQVGDFTEDNVLEPSFRPTLRYVNKRDKRIKLDRGDGNAIIEALTTESVQDGDAIWPVNNVKIIVKWEPLCCYHPTGQNRIASLARGCASLGISLVHTPNPQITHHLVTSFTASTPVAASLLSATQFVKSEWLEEVVRLGNATEDGVSSGVPLEQTFALPPLGKYRPAFSPTLQDSQKVFKIWEPNEERLNMLKDYRFFLVAENVQATGLDVKDLIQRGGGSYEFLDTHAGKAKWHKAFMKGNAKEGQKLVAVGARAPLKMTLGEGGWQDLLNELEISGLPFISPDDLVQVVINIDTGGLEKRSSSESKAQGPPPERMLKESAMDGSTLGTVDEPSVRPRRLIRSVTSRQNSTEPPENVQGVTLIRRTLPRRTNPEEPTTTETISPTVQTIDLTAPMPTRSVPLKRRRNSPASVPMVDTAQQSSESGRYTKKLKQVFDMGQTQDLDVDEMYSQLPIQINHDAFSQMQSQTQTQSKTLGTAKPLSLPKLVAVPEEEEETQAVHKPPSHNRGTKRKAETLVDIKSAIAAKKPRSHAVEEKQVADEDARKAPESTGAPIVNKPDTDPSFLKAIASTKKGKRKEDEFDRDFNKLKITRPEIDQQEEEWDVVDGFGNDTGIRGNFMVIVEMNVPMKEGRAQAEVVSNWQGRSNFKKFKKRISPSSRSKVELVLSEDNDYGLGPSYWKDGNSQSQGNQPALSQKVEVHAGSGWKGRRRDVIIDESDDDMKEAPSQPKRPKRGRAKKTAQTLFLESDLEQDMEVDEEASTMKSSIGSEKKEAKRKARVAIVDDDSDDGAVFKGFRTGNK